MEIQAAAQIIERLLEKDCNRSLLSSEEFIALNAIMFHLQLTDAYQVAE